MGHICVVLLEGNDVPDGEFLRVTFLDVDGLALLNQGVHTPSKYPQRDVISVVQLFPDQMVDYFFVSKIFHRDSHGRVSSFLTHVVHGLLDSILREGPFSFVVDYAFDHARQETIRLGGPQEISRFHLRKGWASGAVRDELASLTFSKV